SVGALGRQLPRATRQGQDRQGAGGRVPGTCPGQGRPARPSQGRAAGDDEGPRGAGARAIASLIGVTGAQQLYSLGVVVNVDPLSVSGPVRRPHARQPGAKPRRPEAAEQFTTWL